MSRLAAFTTAILLIASPVMASPEEQKRLDRRVTDVEDRLALARERMLDIPMTRAETEITLARMYLRTAGLLSEDPKKQQEWQTRAERSLFKAELSIIPSRSTEARGLFLDAGSMPKNVPAMRELLDRLAEANFNIVFPEVFRRGYTCYPSRYTAQDPEFIGKSDMLKVLVDEAQLRGIEVHPWIWTFRVRSPGYGNPVLDRLPALAARGSTTTEPRFLSPAEPLARQWVYDLVDELIGRYRVDGLLLDYIRYDEQTPDDSLSQSLFAAAYQARHGIAPPRPIFEGHPAAIEYQLWREEQVNQTVRQLSSRLKEKGLSLSVSTFRGEAYGRKAKLQNWRHWADNGWISFNASMLYTSRASDLRTWIGWETDEYTRPSPLYPILGPHRMVDPVEETLEQVQVVRRLNQPGVLLFALAHLKPGVLEALAAGPFRRPASIPHRFPIHAARRELADLERRYLAGVQAKGNPDLSETVQPLRRELRQIQLSLPLDRRPYTQNDTLAARLVEIDRHVARLKRDRQLPEPVADEISHRLAYAQTLVRANDHLVKATRYVPPTLPPVAKPSTEARD